MNDTKRELMDLSDEVWRRTRASVDGLTDEEYFWEPAPGCWSIRQRSDGSWMGEWPLPPPDPAPFTTLAWRLWHVTDMYGENRAPEWLNVPPQGEAVGMDANDPTPPSNAADAIDLLERAHDRWDAHLQLVTDDGLGERIGAVAGPDYAERTRAAYVLHMLDEFIHHGAEVALLRDLWRWQHPVAANPLLERVIRGDLSILDELDVTTAGTDLADYAAEYGRWQLLLGLIERGVPVSDRGRTPLHVAAGGGELAVVKALLARGADPTIRDPEYKATPLQWAQFLNRAEVVAFLIDQG